MPVGSGDLPPAERRTLWRALAWPYLDTEPTEDQVQDAVRVLVSSGKSMAELRQIDRREVAPALWREGWFGDWYVTDAPDDPVLLRIAARLRRPSWLLRLTALLTHPLTSAVSRRYWRRVETLIREEREQP